MYVHGRLRQRVRADHDALLVERNSNTRADQKTVCGNTRARENRVLPLSLAPTGFCFVRRLLTTRRENGFRSIEIYKHLPRRCRCFFPTPIPTDPTKTFPTANYKSFQHSPAPRVRRREHNTGDIYLYIYITRTCAYIKRRAKNRTVESASNPPTPDV